MNDSWCESPNAGKPFLCFGFPVEDILGGGLDINGDSSGDLKYREEYSETYSSEQWLSKKRNGVDTGMSYQIRLL